MSGLYSTARKENELPEDKKVSKAQQQAVNRYVQKNYDRINVTFRKGMKEELKTAADKHGESVNAYIVRAVTTQLDNEE